MNCNKNDHKAIIDMGELICPFCDKEISSYETKKDFAKECCDKMEIINDRGEMVCRRCGQIHEYHNSPEYIDFHENMYKIRRKSVYHRKYHVENVLYQNNIRISFDLRDKIIKCLTRYKR